jgi:uncharacterized protein
VVVVSTALNDSSVRIPPDVLAAVETPPDEVAAPPIKVERPTPGFWESLGWIVVLIAVIGIIPYFGALVVAALAGVPLSRVMEPAMFVGQVAGAAFAIALLRSRAGKGWVAEVGLNRLPVIPSLLAVLCVPGLQVFLGTIALLLKAALGMKDPIGDVLKESVTSFPWWFSVLVIAVGPAINEELWFRGFLGRGLLGRFGPTVGILLTSVLFGAFHLNPIQGAYATLLGVVLHLIYRATRSLWVPILTHFSFNLFAVIATAISGGLSEANQSVTAEGVTFAAVSLGVMVAAGLGLYALRVRPSEPAK